MTKVLINRCFGGFGLSDAAIERYAELKGMTLVKIKNEKFSKLDGLDLVNFKENEDSFGGGTWYIDGIEDDDHYFSSYSLNHSSNRADPFLIQAFEEMGDAANNWASDLAIVEIPDDVEWHIAEYDGREHVAENHRTWD